MRFDRVPIGEAEGAILAHSVAHGQSVFKKGRRLSTADVEALAAHGVTAVLAARLEAGDVAEDIAAGRIATALAAGRDRKSVV